MANKEEVLNAVVAKLIDAGFTKADGWGKFNYERGPVRISATTWTGMYGRVTVGYEFQVQHPERNVTYKLSTLEEVPKTVGKILARAALAQEAYEERRRDREAERVKQEGIEARFEAARAILGIEALMVRADRVAMNLETFEALAATVASLKAKSP